MGRFAPTPSGSLHLGSLYTAVAGYLDARAHQGRWLIRIEDLDRAREAKGSSNEILRTLEAFGLEWDDTPVRQSGRSERYRQVLEDLRGRGLTFDCSCTRAELQEESRYPGTCRPGPRLPDAMTATRLRIEPERIEFVDRVQGPYGEDVAALAGDVILKRRDQVIAYVLAVVVDDADQGITHVVRGADLLDNTPRQIYLQRLLEYPSPSYAHVPVLTEPDDAKLAKSRRSVRLEPHCAITQLIGVFRLLGLDCPPSLSAAKPEQALAWAVSEWDMNDVPKRTNLRATG